MVTDFQCRQECCQRGDHVAHFGEPLGVVLETLKWYPLSHLVVHPLPLDHCHHLDLHLVLEEMLLLRKVDLAL